MKVLSLLLCCYFAAIFNGFASTNSWTGAGGDDLWSNPANWSRGEVPVAEDEVFITQSGLYSVAVDTDVQILSLTLGGASGAQTLILSAQGLAATSVTIGTNGLMISQENNGFFGYNKVSGTITNFGTIRLYDGLGVESLYNFGVLEVASDIGRTFLSVEALEAPAGFWNHGSISIGANATLTLGNVHFVGSTISTGEGVLDFSGPIFLPAEAYFGTDVVFQIGTITGNSVWSGHGTFYWNSGSFENGAATLTSNFTFKVQGGGDLQNFQLRNEGLFVLQEGASAGGDTLENKGTILLDGNAHFGGLINRGSIVVTNGSKRLVSLDHIGITNVGGVFHVAAGADLELVGPFSFQDQTSFTGGGGLELSGVNIDGSGGIFVENVVSLAGTVRGDFVWQGPGTLRFHEGALEGPFGSDSGGTTIAQGFTLETAEEIPPKQFSQNFTNFGLIKIVADTRLSASARVANYGTIHIQPGASFFGANLSNEGTIVQTNGTLEISNTMTNNGTLILASGLVSILGKNCSSFDCVRPTGKYIAGPSATHLFTIKGYASQTDFPRMLVWDLIAGGSVEVQFANGFMPTNRSSFKLWEYQTASNNFTSANLPTLSPPMFWETVFHRNQYTIRTREPNHPTATLQSQYDSDGVALTLAVPNGIAYEVEASTNLVDWTTVQTNFTGSYYYQFTPQAELRPSRMFFRTFEP